MKQFFGIMFVTSVLLCEIITLSSTLPKPDPFALWFWIALPTASAYVIATMGVLINGLLDLGVLPRKR